MSYKKVPFMELMLSAIRLIARCLTCQPRLNDCGLFICESVWLPDCSPISCFYNIFTLLCTSIVLPWVVCHFLHGVLPSSLPDNLLINCVLSVIDIVVDGPIYI